MKTGLKKILLEITPSEAEEKELKLVFKQVSSALKKKLPTTKPVLAGSAAKCTRLKDNREMDVFLKFPLKTIDISGKTLKALKNFNPEIVKGSREYYSLNLNGYNVEVIPVYDIKHAYQASNIMDFSPLHVDYVKKNLKNAQEVLLLKHFCKQNGLYGAESYVKGFSGYALELLIIKYGSFERVLRNASNWGEHKTIDFGKKISLTDSQKTSLILLDPVQPSRNAANALSADKYAKFIKISKDYFKNDLECSFSNKNSLEYFKRQKEHSQTFYCEKFHLTGKKDIFLSKLDKKLRRINFELEKLGFSSRYGIIPEEHVFFFLLNKKIPKKMIHLGPKTSMQEHCAVFRTKWESQGYKVIAKNDRLIVALERPFTDGLRAVNALLSST